MKFTQVAADAFEKLQLNAGVLLTEFDPSTAELDRTKIFGATSGGVSFTAAPEFTDFGEDVDNVPVNMKEFKKLSSVTATMSGTFLTVDTEMARRLIGAADIQPDGKVVPRVDLIDSDFFDVWWVGDYSDVNTGESAGFIAIRLINALSTGGFQIQSGKDAKGTMSFEFTGHYSLSDITVVPFEIYIQKGENEAGADLSALSLGAASLTPTFDADVTEYTASTSSSTNTITATPADSAATVSVTLDDEPVTGNVITWDSGETQVVKVVVTNGDATKTYTITVTVG